MFHTSLWWKYSWVEIKLWDFHSCESYAAERFIYLYQYIYYRYFRSIEMDLLKWNIINNNQSYTFSIKTGRFIHLTLYSDKLLASRNEPHDFIMTWNSFRATIPLKFKQNKNYLDNAISPPPLKNDYYQRVSLLLSLLAALFSFFHGELPIPKLASSTVARAASRIPAWECIASLDAERQTRGTFSSISSLS